MHVDVLYLCVAQVSIQLFRLSFLPASSSMHVKPWCNYYAYHYIIYSTVLFQRINRMAVFKHSTKITVLSINSSLLFCSVQILAAA